MMTVRALDVIPNCQVTAADAAPPASSPILNIKFIVTNDEDSRVGSGFWALDQYVKTVTIWQTNVSSSITNAATFYGLVLYSGSFQTFAGALDPNNGTTGAGPAIVELFNSNGSIDGGYIVTFAGTFTPGLQPVTGLIGPGPNLTGTGPFNFGGTMADVLSGTAGTGDTSPFIILPAYFHSVSGELRDPFGFLYTLYTGSGPTWCNSSAGNIGDIITTSPTTTTTVSSTTTETSLTTTTETVTETKTVTSQTIVTTTTTAVVTQFVFVVATQTVTAQPVLTAVQSGQGVSATYNGPVIAYVWFVLYNGNGQVVQASFVQVSPSQTIFAGSPSLKSGFYVVQVFAVSSSGVVLSPSIPVVFRV